jgi:tetratricopeptide (TPR) repeat protein
MGVDAFDIVAIILGVLFTVRKLDAKRRSHKEFPHVPPQDFEAWQVKEVSVYSAAVLACFGKVFADWGFVYFFAPGMPDAVVRKIGATIDLSWMAVMLITFVRTYQLTQLKSRLRIVLGGFLVESSSELTTELKAALRSMEDNDLDRAIYELRQISLDADESHRAIALHYLGECYLRQGKQNEARQAFQQSTETDPTLALPKDALARLPSGDAPTSAAPSD